MIHNSFWNLTVFVYTVILWSINISAAQKVCNHSLSHCELLSAFHNILKLCVCLFFNRIDYIADLVQFEFDFLTEVLCLWIMKSIHFMSGAISIALLGGFFFFFHSGQFHSFPIKYIFLFTTSFCVRIHILWHILFFRSLLNFLLEAELAKYIILDILEIYHDHLKHTFNITISYMGKLTSQLLCIKVGQYSWVLVNET